MAKLLRNLLLLVAAVVILEGVGWSQCAMCRTALQNSPEGQAVAEGFRYGIVFLLAAPYAILGSIAVGLTRAYVRKRASGFRRTLGR
jgi:TRAP-type mannitol/chloroaromatic compound transport system permease small subunit